MELALGSIDRCRKLYEKYVEWNPSAAGAWSRFAELEASLGEADRARALSELAIAQPALDMPEALWKAYIDFEIAEGEREGARAVYERLLQRTHHVKVWLSYAKFEATPLSVLAASVAEDGETEEEDAARVAAAEAAEAEADDSAGGSESRVEREARARAVYDRAFKALRELQSDAKEEAVMLLEAWRDFEKQTTTAAAGAENVYRVSEVEAKMPRRVKRKRPIELEDGTRTGGLEEYYDYIFPDEAAAAPNLKILEAAYRWKKQKMAAADE